MPGTKLEVLAAARKLVAEMRSYFGAKFDRETVSFGLRLLALESLIDDAEDGADLTDALRRTSNVLRQDFDAFRNPVLAMSPKAQGELKALAKQFRR